MKKFRCTLKFLFNSWGTIKIVFIFLTQMCTKRFVNISAKFWENMLTCFRFMDFMSNWHDLGESMQRSARPNRGKGLRVKVNCYHKALHLECCRSPRYASGRRRCQLNVKLEIQIDIYKVDCFRFKNCRFVQVRIFQLLLTIVAVGKLVYNWKYNL